MTLRVEKNFSFPSADLGGKLGRLPGRGDNCTVSMDQRILLSGHGEQRMAVNEGSLGIPVNPSSGQ